MVGSPPIRHASYGTARVGMCAAIPTPPGVAPVHQSRTGRLSAEPKRNGRQDCRPAPWPRDIGAVRAARCRVQCQTRGAPLRARDFTDECRSAGEGRPNPRITSSFSPHWFDLQIQLRPVFVDSIRLACLRYTVASRTRGGRTGRHTGLWARDSGQLVRAHCLIYISSAPSGSCAE